MTLAFQFAVFALIATSSILLIGGSIMQSKEFILLENRCLIP